jgi:hypothetical protein
MKYIGMTMLIILILGPLCIAQGSNKPIYFINAGLAFPSAPSEFSTNWNTGFNIEAGLGAPLSDYLMLIGDLTYCRFALNGEKLLGGSYYYQSEDVTGGVASFILLAWGIRVNLAPRPNKVCPYLLGSVGLFEAYRSNAYVEAFDNSELILKGNNEATPGYSIGAGFEINLSPKINLLLGMKYIVGLTSGDNTEFSPLQVGLVFK